MRIDAGDTAWVLISAALVLFMTPGLALFYGGMVRAKSALNMIMMSFAALGVVTIAWITVGFTIAFGASNAGVVGGLTGGLRDIGLIDTIGQNTKLPVDAYRTPHTDKLHVTERWRMIENGAKLEILIAIDDSDTFNQPFQVLRQYDRVNREFSEDICSENNLNPFGIDYMMPIAEKPDF